MPNFVATVDRPVRKLICFSRLRVFVFSCFPAYRDDKVPHTIMKIFKSINRVPGGLMVVPLLIGMVINTFFPDLLKIGGFTQALSGTGYPTVLGMYLFT